MVYTKFQSIIAINQVFRRMVGIFSENTPFRDELVDINISELIVRLLQTRSRQHFTALKETYPYSNGIVAALNHISKNIHRRIPIKELADVAWMSRANFYRYFKNELGYCPHQYIKKERIDKACSLLKDKRLTITEVCSRLGFKSISHFGQVFKEQKGLTPKSYQKIQLSNRFF